MKRLAAVALLVVLAVGCGARNGGGRGLVIQRTADGATTPDHGDLDRQVDGRPVGQR